MTDNSIISLIKGSPVATPEDSIRRAAGLIGGTHGSQIPVLSGGQITGTVSERGISAYLVASDDTEAALNSSLSEIVEPNTLFINSGASLKDAALIFAANSNDVLPVIDNYGGYQGVIYRRDLVGRLTKSLRPPAIAGMATPLGVYLTTGSISGGAGSLGLFLTGVSLGLMIVFSALVVAGFEAMLAKVSGLPIGHFVGLMSRAMAPGFRDLPFYLSTAATGLVFLVLMRLSPLSGYHAAEHMTVHAIEAGEPLEPESVSRMPRVHPRCGTNLLAAAGLFTIITARLDSQTAVLIALLVVVLGWRSVGGWLQRYATTSNPSLRQLKSGISAGRELLERYQQTPNIQLIGFQRIWKLGLLQTFAGMASVLGFLSLFSRYIPVPWLF